VNSSEVQTFDVTFSHSTTAAIKKTRILSIRPVISIVDSVHGLI